MAKATAVISHTQYVVTNASKIGATDPIDLSFESANQSQMRGNGLTEDGAVIWSYTVPDGKKSIVESLDISASVLSLWEENLANAGSFDVELGKAYANIAGTQASEERITSKNRLLSNQLNDNNGASGPYSAPKPNRALHMGDGFLLTNGQVFSVTFDPKQGTDGIKPMVIHAWMHAIDSVTNAVITAKNELFPTGYTTGQTVLTYTAGSNGITVLGWHIWGDSGPPMIADALELYLNEVKFAELGLFLYTINRTKGPRVSFPLYGVTLGSGTTISLHGRPYTALGQLINVVLYGEEKPVGYPRHRLVNV